LNNVYRSIVSKALNCDVKSLKFPNHLEVCYKHLQTGLQTFQNLKLEFLKFRGHEIVQLSENQLKVGYENLRKRLTEITFTTGLTTSISSVFSGVWVAFTGTPLLEAPVPLVALAVGGGIVVNQAIEAYHIKKYARLSILSNPIGPAISNEMNDKIQKIIAGSNPKVKLTRSGLEITGPLGNLENPSLVRENILSQIRSMKKIVIPSCVLGKHVDPLVNNINKCWTSSLALSFSFFHILTTFNKNRSLADYVFVGSSLSNIYNYFHGESIGEVRKKFSYHLEKGKTPEEILKLLIDGHDLQEGMSFLQPWTEGTNTLGIRMDWTGRVILYKNFPESSFFPIGGAYPIQEFPRESIREKASVDEGIFYAFRVFIVAGIAAAILGAKKKTPVES